MGFCCVSLASSWRPHPIPHQQKYEGVETGNFNSHDVGELTQNISAVAVSTVFQRADRSRRQRWAQWAELWCWSHPSMASSSCRGESLSPLLRGYGCRRLPRKQHPSTDVFGSPCCGPQVATDFHVTIPSRWLGRFTAM